MPKETQTEILVKLGRMEEHIKTIRQDIGEILPQVKATNGRVTKLEAWQARFLGERKGISGSWHIFLSVLTACGTMVAIIKYLYQ